MTRLPLTYKDPATLLPVPMDAVQTTVAGQIVNEAVHAVANASGTVIDPATDESVQALGTALAAILAKLGTKLSVSIDGDSITLNLPAGLALDTTGQAAVTALSTLITDVANNHADLTTIHTDTGTTLHADLGAILTRLGQALTVSLPTGASTASNQATANTSLQAIAAALAATLTVAGSVTTNAGTGTSTAALALESGGHLASVDSKLATLISGRTPVDGSGVTQPVSATVLPLPTGAATAAAQGTGNTALAAIQSSVAGTLKTIASGSAGSDLSVNLTANAATIPNVGAAFASSGPYSEYTLAATIPVTPSRAYAEIDNLSAGPLVLVRDDGTAAAGAAPANASLIVLNAAPGVGQPGGGGWSTTTFKGRIQIYAPSGTTPLITAFQD